MYYEFMQIKVCYGPIYGVELKIIKVNGVLFVTDLGINNIKVYAKMRCLYIYMGILW